jgi:hypothetical protein
VLSSPLQRNGAMWCITYNRQGIPHAQKGSARDPGGAWGPANPISALVDEVAGGWPVLFTRPPPLEKAAEEHRYMYIVWC